MIDVQVRGEQLFKAKESLIGAGRIRCAVVRIQELAENFVPEIHLPISASFRTGRIVYGNYLIFTEPWKFTCLLFRSY